MADIKADMPTACAYKAYTMLLVCSGKSSLPAVPRAESTLYDSPVKI
jgi:hypothetical protein